MLKSLVVVSIAIMLIPYVFGVNGDEIVNEFQPDFSVENVLQSLGAPQWLVDNIDLILITLGVLLLLSFLNSLLRGIRTLIAIFRGIYKLIKKIVFYFKKKGEKAVKEAKKTIGDEVKRSSK